MYYFHEKKEKIRITKIDSLLFFFTFIRKSIKRVFLIAIILKKKKKKIGIHTITHTYMVIIKV